MKVQLRFLAWLRLQFDLLRNLIQKRDCVAKEEKE